MRLYGKPLEEICCFKCLVSKVAADGGCEIDVHRMNRGYKMWKALHSVLGN